MHFKNMGDPSNSQHDSWQRFLRGRFQGLDWRKKENWECNQRMNPTGEKWMDGFTVSPHEIMFVKVKDHLVHSTNTLSQTAAKYSDWIDGLVSHLAPFCLCQPC